VPGRAHAQSGFGRVIQVSDRQCSHLNSLIATPALRAASPRQSM
jgi:hypothetical protein